jgi:hypothetical protein
MGDALTTPRGIMATLPAALLRSWGRPSPLHPTFRKGSALPPDPYREGRAAAPLGLSPGLCGPDWRVAYFSPRTVTYVRRDVGSKTLSCTSRTPPGSGHAVAFVNFRSVFRRLVTPPPGRGHEWGPPCVTDALRRSPDPLVHHEVDSSIRRCVNWDRPSLVPDSLFHPVDQLPSGPIDPLTTRLRLDSGHAAGLPCTGVRGGSRPRAFARWRGGPGPPIAQNGHRGSVSQRGFDSRRGYARWWQRRSPSTSGDGLRGEGASSVRKPTLRLTREDRIPPKSC